MCLTFAPEGAIIFIILDCKQICPPFWRKTFYFPQLFTIHIFLNIGCKKILQCLCLQDMQKSGTPYFSRTRTIQAIIKGERERGRKEQVLERIWRNWDTCTLLWEGAPALQNFIVVPQTHTKKPKLNTELSYHLVISLLGVYPKELKVGI